MAEVPTPADKQASKAAKPANKPKPKAKAVTARKWTAFEQETFVQY